MLTYTQMHIYAHTYTRTHKYTRTHIHMHMPTYAYRSGNQLEWLKE